MSINRFFAKFRKKAVFFVEFLSIFMTLVVNII